VLVKTSVASPKLRVFKLRMQSLGVYMTDSELDAMQALLMTEYASPVQDSLQKDRTKIP
jgi:hypothetical protein